VARIVLLALGAAVFPLLLACVAIMISRREPRRLLLAFYAGGLIVSVTSGIVVLGFFKDNEEVLGSDSSAPAPGTSIAVGVVALALAWLMASRRGRSWLDDWRARHPRRRARPEAHKGPSWAERHLDRANAAVTFVVGAAINLPGPFYLLALGDIATGDYTRAEELALILVFNAVMFVLLEVPLIGYLVRPRQTAERVASLSAWLNANGLRVMGWLVGAVGVSLIAQGVSAAAT
jgi:Sap-like sulfolipid-1-addressing protein